MFSLTKHYDQNTDYPIFYYGIVSISVQLLYYCKTRTRRPDKIELILN